MLLRPLRKLIDRWLLKQVMNLSSMAFMVSGIMKTCRVAETTYSYGLEVRMRHV